MSERPSPRIGNTPDERPGGVVPGQMMYSDAHGGNLGENSLDGYSNPLSDPACRGDLQSMPRSNDPLSQFQELQAQDSALAPAGWYPINEHGEQGYWDGHAWTYLTPVATGLPLRKRRRWVVVAVVGGIATIALTIGAVVGISAANRSESSARGASDAPSEAAEENPKPDEGERQEQEAPIDPGGFEELLNMPKPESWDELDAMTLEEFNQQPIEARVEYGGWLNRDYRHLAELWYAESNNPLDKLAAEVTVNPDNTGEEAMVSIMSNIRGALTRHFEMYELNEVPNYTTLQRQKQLTASYLYPNSKSSVEWLRHVSNQEINGYVPGFYVLNGLSTADYTIVNRSENYTVNIDGADRVATKLTVQLEDGEIIETQLALIETPTKSAWVNILAE